MEKNLFNPQPGPVAKVLKPEDMAFAAMQELQAVYFAAANLAEDNHYSSLTTEKMATQVPHELLITPWNTNIAVLPEKNGYKVLFPATPPEVCPYVVSLFNKAVDYHFSTVALVNGEEMPCGKVAADIVAYYNSKKPSSSANPILKAKP